MISFYFLSFSLSFSLSHSFSLSLSLPLSISLLHTQRIQIMHTGTSVLTPSLLKLTPSFCLFLPLFLSFSISFSHNIQMFMCSGTNVLTYQPYYCLYYIPNWAQSCVNKMSDGSTYPGKKLGPSASH